MIKTPVQDKKEGRILIIEDNFDIQLSARLLLKQHYTEVKTHDRPENAIQDLRQNSYDVIILDMNFSRGETSGKEGIHWLRKIMEMNPESRVIMITAFGDIELAIQAIKLGAREFVLKPWQNDKLLATVGYVFTNARNPSATEKPGSLPSNSSLPQTGLDDIISESASFKKVISDIKKVAATGVNVLILGEKGTGKELAARTIHKLSANRNSPFIKVDPAVAGTTVNEPELFGNGNGKNSAAGLSKGVFSEAENGTVFFKEVGDLSLPVQNKLLSELNGNQQVKPRVISASRLALHRMADENTFNADLLYKLGTIEISIPPLRERKEDIPLLAEHFLTSYSKRYGKSKLSISQGAMEKLKNYHWPENVRELRHVIERTVILSEQQVIKEEDLNLEKKNRQDTDLYTLNLEDLEKDAIRQALLKYRGNISQAARELGLTRSALYRRLEKYGL